MKRCSTFLGPLQRQPGRPNSPQAPWPEAAPQSSGGLGSRHYPPWLLTLGFSTSEDMEVANERTRSDQRIPTTCWDGSGRSQCLTRSAQSTRTEMETHSSRVGTIFSAVPFLQKKKKKIFAFYMTFLWTESASRCLQHSELKLVV